MAGVQLSSVLLFTPSQNVSLDFFEQNNHSQPEGLHNLNLKGDNTCVGKILQSDWTIFFDTKVDFFPWNVHSAESGIL